MAALKPDDGAVDDTGLPLLTRVDISGPLEQRAGYHDPCSGWTDGHDAIAERLCAAFASGDVLLVVDSPGGAAAAAASSRARPGSHWPAGCPGDAAGVWRREKGRFNDLTRGV